MLQKKIRLRDFFKLQIALAWNLKFKCVQLGDKLKFKNTTTPVIYVLYINIIFLYT